jgi:hypothetical protein
MINPLALIRMRGSTALLLGNTLICCPFAQTTRADQPAQDMQLEAYIKRVLWDGEEFAVSYRGAIGIKEKAIGSLQGWPDGLAFHPDGRIAVSDGHGTTDAMSMVFWFPDKASEPVVDIRFNKDKMRQMLAYASSDLHDFPADERASEHQRRFTELERRRDELEREGFFWFFAGPMAFDAGGTSYFSLGSCSPNGMYKVNSREPIEIIKLHTLPSTSSLQVPAFDSTRLYSTSWNGIFPYSREPSDDTSTPEPWFCILPRSGLLMHDTLIMSPSKLLVCCLIRKDASRSQSRHDERTLLFDKKVRAFWSLPEDDFGPMAISWDGHRMIHFNKAGMAINAFTLQEKAEDE